MSEKDPLSNSAHEKFAQNVANGMHARDAYLQVFPNGKKRNANKSASRLMHRPEIVSRLDYLKRCNAELSMWTRADSMEILRNIAENPHKKDCDRINAVNILNQMCGFTEPEKKIIAQNTFFQFISPDRGIKGE
ncbi:MAG: hypothetical protein J5858_05620 [Lentisphaeria bacterium]|nr:hypothetical protein [Lentisphaeria bacterium]